MLREPFDASTLISDGGTDPRVAWTMFDDEPVGGACNDPNGGSASVVPVTDHNGAAGAAVAVIANADGQPGRYTQARS